MGLNLPNASVRALTDEEMKTAKDVLAARAASAGRVTAEKINAQLMVAAGEWVPAFQLSLQSVVEARGNKLEAVTRAFKEGMPLPPAPQPLQEPFDVWSIAAPPRSGPFVPKDFLLIPATLEKKDCQACLGKASVPCKICFAKGAVNCDACMGAGAQPCTVCKGTSKISCPDCEGSGRVKGGAGSRSAGPCGSCSGVGKFSCSHCNGGKVDCPPCGNTGRKPCGSCEGQGKQNCTVCAGSAKVVIGKALVVEFRAQQAQASVMGAPAPQEAEAMALSQKSAPTAFDFDSEDALKRDMVSADISEGLRGSLEQLLGRVRPANASARMSGLKLSVARGEAWRLTGSFAGHEFIYWIHPSTHTVVPEKDPLGEVSRKSAETAQDALRRGDWEVAVDAARESLSLNPHDAGAKTIASQWRRKLLQEALLTGAGAGALGALISAAMILGAEKGLYRFGPMVLTGGLALAVGLGTGVALLPVLRHLFPAKKRMLVGGGACLAVVLILTVVTRGMAGWNPVRDADQKALRAEMAQQFKYGASAVYMEAELNALQALYEKYKNSQADLTDLNKHMESQISLKTQHDALTREFHQKLEDVLDSNAFGADKRAKIEEIRDHYALRNVDVAAAEEALKKMDEQVKKANQPGAQPRSTRGKISITPLHPTSSSSRKKSSASSRAPSKPAVKKAAPKAVKPAASKKKKIKPNKEVDPKAAATKKRKRITSDTID